MRRIISHIDRPFMAVAVGLLNLPSCIARGDPPCKQIPDAVLVASAENTAQGLAQRLAFGIRADRDAQKLVDARQLEVADDDALAA
jgi:hypothetical protein